MSSTAGSEANVATRYVVSRRMTGLGDNIICLAAAWLFARNTQRTLVADWRRSRYADSQDNLFPLCFEPGTEIAGVPFIADTGADVPLPRSYRPALW
jgi:Nodulation protein Z (NodZ)